MQKTAWRGTEKEDRWFRSVCYQDEVFLYSIYLATLVYHQNSVVNSYVSSSAAVFVT
jgi:hypothetical protein